MNPSREAVELLDESRPIFTERRRRPRFWRRWWLPIFVALVFAFHFITRGGIQ